ncbi:MAG: IS110 family transposase [Vicingaceae bacterium]
MEPYILKQSVGIDVSKDSLSICLCTLLSDLSRSYDYLEDQPNNINGFKRICSWLNKHQGEGVHLVVLLEATGVYHERLAEYLYASCVSVSIMQSGRVKRYAQSLDQRSKTDLLDSKMLAMLAIERPLKEWSPPSDTLRKLKGLSRERSVLITERGMLRNRRHAIEEGSYVNKQSMRRYAKRQKMLNTQIKEIEAEMQTLVAGDKELSSKIAYLQSIPGISFIASATVVGETLGFSNITNAKQLTSYVGYDVVQRESGNYKGKTKISKKGNKQIRAILHMPSMAAIRVNPTLKPFYQRLKSSKVKPIIGLVATQRKLLLLMYTLWKKEENYDPEIAQKKATSLKELAAQDSQLKHQLTS